MRVHSRQSGIHTGSKLDETGIGYAFVAPALITFIAFIAFPFFSSLLLSFTDWNFVSGFKGIKWVGIKNFVKLASDKTFIASIKNTLLYVVTTVPISIVIALILAYSLNNKVYCRKTLRLAFFIPYIANLVALGAVFRFLFRSEGIANSILINWFGAEPLKWLANAKLSRIPIIILLTWTGIGYEMIVYMAAIQNVPKELYEAGLMDGTNAFTQFFKITFPMISPTTFYLIIVRTISAFKTFSAVNVLTIGTTTAGNTSIVTEIYEDAFSSYKFGYASAESLILFLILLAITLIQFKGQKKWVNY